MKKFKKTPSVVISGWCVVSITVWSGDVANGDDEGLNGSLVWYGTVNDIRCVGDRVYDGIGIGVGDDDVWRNVVGSDEELIGIVTVWSSSNSHKGSSRTLSLSCIPGWDCKFWMDAFQTRYL